MSLTSCLLWVSLIDDSKDQTSVIEQNFSEKGDVMMPSTIYYFRALEYLRRNDCFAIAAPRCLPFLAWVSQFVNICLSHVVTLTSNVIGALVSVWYKLLLTIPES